jgi:hypothetical protein
VWTSTSMPQKVVRRQASSNGCVWGVLRLHFVHLSYVSPLLCKVSTRYNARSRHLHGATMPISSLRRILRLQFYVSLCSNTTWAP